MESTKKIGIRHPNWRISDRRAICVLTPTPVPTASAVMISCTGKITERAVSPSGGVFSYKIAVYNIVKSLYQLREHDRRSKLQQYLINLFGAKHRSLCYIVIHCDFLLLLHLYLSEVRYFLPGSDQISSQGRSSGGSLLFPFFRRQASQIPVWVP